MEPNDRTEDEVLSSATWQTALLTRLYFSVSGTPNAGISSFRRTKLWIWVNVREKVIFKSLIINSSPAMFDSASNVMISGGHFTASQGNHANVAININGM